METNYNEELDVTRELLQGLTIKQETQKRPSISGKRIQTSTCAVPFSVIISFEIIVVAGICNNLSLYFIWGADKG